MRPQPAVALGGAFIIFILCSACCDQSVFASSYSPVFFPIDNKTSPFANHTRIKAQKVVVVRTNHPVSVILPDETRQGKSWLQKVSRQVFQGGGNVKRCVTVATNGGPFNADGSCVGPVVSHARLRRNATSDWPGFGRGVDKDGNYVYVLGEYSEVVSDAREIQLTDFVTGFGWLVHDGQVVASDDNNPTGAIQAPRTVIGIDGDNHSILLVADGCERWYENVAVIQKCFMERY
jgi:hypothetical protein